MIQAACENILSRGYTFVSIDLPPTVNEAVRNRNWEELDQAIRKETVQGGAIFAALRKYVEFSQIEFIISIRSSREDPDEDGIWHDDGSRVLAFSLSLTLDHAGVGGGRLEIRKREFATPTEVVPTPPYGTMIVFATGFQGFEHKINRVTEGERIIIAGWCT